MNISELKKALKPDAKIKITGQNFTVLQHILWHQAKSDSDYDKFVLQDDSGDSTYRLFISGNFIGFSTLIHHSFAEPLPKHLNFENKNYTQTQDEFCIVKTIEGQEFYKVGDCEIWWDYSCDDDDGTGLSLGRNWETWEREDLKTQEIKLEKIKSL